MLWIWSYPVSKKEWFLKLAVPIMQAKFLKTICETFMIVFAGSRAEISLKETTLSQVFLKGLEKLAYHPLVCGIVKNLII